MKKKFVNDNLKKDMNKISSFVDKKKDFSQVMHLSPKLNLNLSNRKKNISPIRINFISPKINDKNKNFFMSLKKINTKFYNFAIFKKREIAFKKSIITNKKYFKYKSCSILEDSKINSTERKSNLYLTDKINNFSERTLPFLANDTQKFSNYNFHSLSNETRKRNRIQYIAKKIKDNIFTNYEEDEEDRQKKFDKKLLIYKNNKKYQNNLNNHLIKFKKILLEKFQKKIKIEKYNLLKENQKEKIEIINDKINSLENDFDNLDNKISGKFAIYVRQLEKFISHERFKDNILIDDIYKLKQDISFLKSKYMKIQDDYNDIMKWVYFFICIKEEKLKLPEYYKIILENNDKIKNIDNNLINKIIKYKNNVMFNNADEFIEQMKLYEINNFKFFEKLNNIKEELSELKNLKKILNNNKNNNSQKAKKLWDVYFNIQLKKLNDLKIINEKLIEEKKSLKNVMKNSQKQEKITSIKKNNSNVYNKVIEISLNIEHSLK